MPLIIGELTLDRASYQWIEHDEQPNFEIKITPGGSGCAASGTFPSVPTFRPIYWIRPLEVCCIGTDADDAFAKADALLAEIVAANTKERTVYLSRTVPGQTTPRIWTVLGGVPRQVRCSWDRLYKVWYHVDLYVYPGQLIPPGTP